MFATSLLVAAGCSFGVESVPIDGGVDAAIDDGGAETDLMGASPDLATTPDLAPDLALGFCDQPSLIACYQFEDGAGATLAHDGSPNHNDLTLSAAPELLGGHAGGALSMSSGSLAHVAHAATQDAQRLTYEMWIDPTTLPAMGARSGLVDEDGEYGLFIYAPGVLTCTIGGAAVSSAVNTIVTGAWQHVGCSYDGAAVRLYYNDALVGSTATSAAVATGQANGLAIGSNSPSADDFDGMIDDVRIFSIAR